MATKVTTGLLSDNSVTDAKLSATITATTQSASDNTTKVATTAFVSTAIANLADSAPSTLNTLNELAAALGDDANYATTTTNAIAAKLPLAGGTMTGTLAMDAAIDIKSGSAINGTITTSSNSLTLNARNTGILLFQSGGNEKMRIDASGNVGIGTTSPSAPLDVEVSSNVFAGEFKQTNTSNGDGVHIRLGSAAAADYGLRVDSDAGNTAGFVVKADGNVGIGTFTPSHPLTIQNSHQLTDVTGMSGNTTLLVGNTGSGDGVYNALQFSGNQQSMYIASINHGQTASRRLGFFLGSAGGDAVADERLSITGNGNVGIGTTSPNLKLHVEESLADTWIADFKHTHADGYGLRVDLSGTTSSTRYALGVYTGGGTGLFVRNNGKVGIGTTSPLTPLHVVGANGLLLDTEGNGDGSVYFGNISGTDRSYIARSSNDLLMWNVANGPIRFGCNNTERMRIANNGFVGIGSTGVTDSVSGAAGPTLRIEGSNPEIVFSDNSGTANQLSLYYLNNGLYFHSPQKTGGAGTVMSFASEAGNLGIVGALSKGSGSFKIDHPLEAKKDTHHLVHSFIEGPQADLIYRGVVDLVDGTATINIDTISGMTEGTYVLLNTNTSCFTSNETDWDAVKGSVTGNILTISCQNNSSTATVSWLVIGERHDQHMYDTDWTDENGKVIVEPLKTEEMPQVNSGE